MDALDFMERNGILFFRCEKEERPQPLSIRSDVFPNHSFYGHKDLENFWERIGFYMMYRDEYSEYVKYYYGKESDHPERLNDEALRKL